MTLLQRIVLPLCRYGLLLAIVLIVCSCQPLPQNSETPTEKQFKAVAIDPKRVVASQTVYVPVYSHIYQHSNRDPVMNLSATLSIRNTDLDHDLIIRSVRYYNNDGELVRTYLQTPIELGHLASVDYFIETRDESGGLGANFIVEWVSETAISEPVIEALMINTAGNQGISFISPGRVIKRQGTAAP